MIAEKAKKLLALVHDSCVELCIVSFANPLIPSELRFEAVDMVFLIPSQTFEPRLWA